MLQIRNLFGILLLTAALVTTEPALAQSSAGMCGGGSGQNDNEKAERDEEQNNNNNREEEEARIFVGPTGKTRINRRASVDYSALYNLRSKRIALGGTFLYDLVRFSKKNAIYTGVGLTTMLPTQSINTDIKFGPRVPIGISLFFAPKLETFVEFSNIFIVTPDTKYAYDVGTGVRYYFGSAGSGKSSRDKKKKKKKKN